MSPIASKEHLQQLSEGRTLFSDPWKGVKLHAAVVAIIAVSLPFLKNPSSTFFLGGFLCLPTYLILGFWEASRSPLFFTPSSFYFFWYSIGLGLSAIYTASALTLGSGVAFSVATVSPEDLAEGYVIFLVGSLALHIGLQLFRPREAASHLRVQPVRHPLIWIIVLWMIGLWSKWDPSIVAPLGNISQLFQMMPFAALCSFILVKEEEVGLPRTVFMILLGLGMLGLFAVSLMSGSKAFIMFSFFPLVWLFILRPSLRIWFPVFGLGLMVFYFLLVVPVVSQARLDPQAEEETPANLIIQSFRNWERSGPLASLETVSYRDYLTNFLERQFDPTPVGYFVGKVKESGYCHGATMSYAFYAFIPRLLWPGKPNVTRGAWFTMYLGFSPSEEEATTSTGMTATGELYWNFGILGVWIGMLAIGCFIGKLWSMAGLDPRQNLFGMLLYAILMLNMPNMPEAVTVFSGLLAYLLMFKAIFLALEMMRRSGGRIHDPLAS